MAGMPWIRLDSDYLSNQKTNAAGVHGRALHVASICWSAQQLSDGHVPSHVVPLLAFLAGVPADTVATVVDSGLWVPNGSGFVVHDYLDFNPSREQVEHRRARWRETKKRARS